MDMVAEKGEPVDDYVDDSSYKWPMRRTLPYSFSASIFGFS